RRRHTISKRDWSSDVCSSDLCQRGNEANADLAIAGTSSGLGSALTNLALAAGHQVVATTRQSTLPIEDPRLVEIQLDPADMQDCRAGRCGTLLGPWRMGCRCFPAAIETPLLSLC